MSAPGHSIFISYRRLDSVYAVDQLDERLKQAFGADAVFRDASSIGPGAVFPRRIRDALGLARVALVVIGPAWLRATTDPDDSQAPRRIDDPADWVRLEIETLLGRGDDVSVIPVLLGGASLPKAAKLPAPLRALPARNGMTLPPFPNFEDSLQQIIEAVAGLLDVAPQPDAAVMPPVAEKPPRFGGHSFSVTGKKFVGREQELHLLDEAWGRAADDKINIVSFIGQGGEGKSAIVLDWLARRARNGWQGARRVFEWSFYSQGTSAQSSASADEFFNAAFAWLGPECEVPKDSYAKGAKLAELVAADRTLLVLDGLEPLQQPPGGFGGEFKDPAMKALLHGLARHNPGLCVLTSRTDITDVSAFEGEEGSCLRHRLDSLDPAAARALLRELGVLGPDREVNEAAAWFHRHAYDLNLLGNYLAKCTTDHDIRGWQQRFPILQEDERIHPIPDEAGRRAGHGVRMLRAYERWLGADSPALAILRLLGLFDRPARSDLLDELRAAPAIPGLTDALFDETLVPLPDADWLLALDQLEGLALIHREPLFLPAGRAEVEEATVSADEVSDEMVDRELTNPSLPEHIKNMPRAEFRQFLAQALAAEKNKFAKSAERPRRAVTFALDTHPLLREHFAAELRAAHDDAWRERHRRLYAYLCATTPDKPDATLEDLQPLYQAVAHGCQAALQQEAHDDVHLRRIRRGGREDYCVNRLGAFGTDLGANACFFEIPWSVPSPNLRERDQAILLSMSAFRLRALGRLTEALEPMRAGLEMGIKSEDWEEASRRAGNLSELELTLGEVAGAARDAERSVTYADRSGDWFQRMGKRTTHADVLHQGGHRAEAGVRFREAEQMQVERQPAYPLLYGFQGFQYCDLLLTKAERAAWQVILARGNHWPSHEQSSRTEERLSRTLALPEARESCRAVSERAAQTLMWVTDGNLSILAIALSHLALGRAALYAVVLSCDTEPSSSFDLPKSHLASAVSGLRRAGTQHMIPHGLLNRALQRSLIGALTHDQASSKSAQSDLDEAWETAERGPMPLFLADVHLYRARLFGANDAERESRNREEDYPWESPQHDLAEARRLIEERGYLRRLPELEDAEAALLPSTDESTP